MYIDYDTLFTMLRLANRPSTFTPTRSLTVDGAIAFSLLCGAIDRVCERLDDLLYPEHQEQPLGKPIFIVAAPRSGTTFLHRLMSLDEQFTTFKLVESFFPTVTGQRALAKLTDRHGVLGGALHKIGQRADDTYFGAWKGLHDTGLNHDEEDEAIWGLAFSTPAIWLLLPYPEAFDSLRYVDRMPEEKREKLSAFYRSCVQRHLYANPGKTLLGKNVLLPGRFDTVKRALPDARFIHIVRHPYEAVASALSLFTVPWRWHSPELASDGPESRALAQLIIDYYKRLHDKQLEATRAGEDTFVSFTYRSLLADPLARIGEIYERFGLTLTDPLRARLTQAVEQQRNYKSEHQYSLEQFGLTREYVYGELRQLFEAYGFER